MIDRRKFMGGAVAASAAFSQQTAEQDKAEIKDAQYVILELLGYKKMAGRLMQGPAGLLRFDAAVEGGYVTQLINPTSIYRATIVGSDVVKEYAKYTDPLPAVELEIQPRQKAIPFGPDQFEDEYDDEDRPF